VSGEGGFIGVTLLHEGSCVDFGFLEIGFVLHKRGEFVEDSLQV
jgi:hypothetical protein